MLEKGLKGRFVDLRRGGQLDPAYLRPGAAVPTLVHDGNVLAESSVALSRRRPPFAAVDAGRTIGALPRSPKAFSSARISGIRAKSRRRWPAFRIPGGAVASVPRRPWASLRPSSRTPRAIWILSCAKRKKRSPTGLLGGSAHSLANAAARPYVNRLEMLGVRGVVGLLSARHGLVRPRSRAPQFRGRRRAPLYGRRRRPHAAGGRGRPRRGDSRALTRAGLREDENARLAAAFRPFPEPAPSVRLEPCGFPARPPFSADGGLRQ